MDFMQFTSLLRKNKFLSNYNFASISKPKSKEFIS